MTAAPPTNQTSERELARLLAEANAEADQAKNAAAFARARADALHYALWLRQGKPLDSDTLNSLIVNGLYSGLMLCFTAGYFLSLNTESPASILLLFAVMLFISTLWNLWNKPKQMLAEKGLPRNQQTRADILEMWRAVALPLLGSVLAVVLVFLLIAYWRALSA